MHRFCGALISVAIVLLEGCAAPSPIPIVERRQPPSEKINTHWVAEGETLYAIAWRYNMDVDRLARANGLDPARPTIYRGQVLQLDLAKLEQAQRTRWRSVPTRSSQPAKPRASTAQPGRLQAWRWPVKGSVLKRYSFAAGKGHKGLDIRGSSGQPVYAAQNGVVVYAGTGLPAYGKLLIVKHGDSYLSAYAHNSRLVVKEGQSVTVGQKIAEVGKSGTTHEHLHFEIRKQGRPVNPLTLLPQA